MLQSVYIMLVKSNSLRYNCFEVITVTSFLEDLHERVTNFELVQVF